jgi:hypothetical protein
MSWPRPFLTTLCVAIFISAGCKKSATTSVNVQPVPSARDDGGWPVYEVKGDGFSISLPPSWRQIEMDPATFDAKFQEVAKGDANLAAMRDQLKTQMAQGAKFFGVDPAGARTGFATNVNVLRLPMPPGSTLDKVVAENLRQAEAEPFIKKPMTHERVQSAGDERERIRYHATLKGPGGQEQRLAITQFVLVRGDAYYVVTGTATADQESKFAADLDKIGRSFRFTK